MLCEGFYGSQQQLSIRIAGHGAEPPITNVGIGDGLGMPLLEVGFPVKQINVSGSAVLEEIDHTFCFGGKVWQ